MRKLYTALFISIISINLFSQIIKSPESYAFEKFGNVPVNLYTGSIDLKIPIFKNDLVNIFLSYDSSGYIPHKKSDLAGMNWTLVAGGRVTRSIKQVPDDHEGYPLPSSSSDPDYNGFLYGVRKYPYTNAQVYDVNNGGAGSEYAWGWHLGPAGKDSYETEPDVFYFNVMDLHGKFMIGNDGNVLVESTTPNIKVDLSNMKTYGNWWCNVPVTEIKITDGKGNQYFFGGDKSNLELYYPKSSPHINETQQNESVSNKMYINAFSLSKIIFSSGKTVEFNYMNGSFAQSDWCRNMTDVAQIKANSKLLSLESYHASGILASYSKDCLFSCHMNGGAGGWESDHYGMIKKSLLESIKFDNNEIKINYKDAGYYILHWNDLYYPNTKDIYPNETLIDNIQVYNNNILIQQDTFSYNDYGDWDNKRPFLSKVKEENTNKEYAFEYYDTYRFPVYYTTSIDHWGYYNGFNGNRGLIPLDTYNQATGDYTLNNTFRDPRHNVTGLLQKVIYPTKGFTVFEYESPTYGKRLERNSSSKFLPVLTDNSGFTGGARIKKQYDFSSNGIFENEREYKYTTKIDNENSSGILMHWPRYILYLKYDSHETTLFNATSTNIQETSLDSYNVGYSKVFEINKNKGVIEHNFYSYLDKPDIFADVDNVKFINIYGNASPEYLFKNKEKSGIDRSILRGRLKSQIIYDANMKPLKKIEDEYTDNMDFNPNSTKDNNNYVAINHQFFTQFIQGYKRYLNPSYLKKQVETNYLKTDSIKVSTEYYYDSNAHLNLSRENTVLPDKTSITKNYSYAEDLRHGNQPQQYIAPYQFIAYMIAYNMTGFPLVTTSYINNKFLNRNQTIYEKNANNNLVLPKKDLFYSEDKIQVLGENSLSPVILPLTNYGSVEKSYDSYDNKGNILQYTIKPDTNGNGTPVTIIWGYNQTLPIAKIEGAKYDDVKALQTVIDAVSASDSDTDQASENTLINKLDLLRKDGSLANYQITTYTHNPLIGVTSITPPSGIREIYKYDTGNRLERVVDVSGNILKEYQYKFSKERFYNNAINTAFYKNNCGPNYYIVGYYGYYVPYGKYSSVISQQDADQQAINDTNANGQNAANASMTCTPMNCTIMTSSGVVDGEVGLADSTNFSLKTTFNSNISTDWMDYVMIGKKVTGNCIPISEEKYASCQSNGLWFGIMIDTQGNISVRSLHGLPLAPNTNYNLEFTIPIN